MKFFGFRDRQAMQIAWLLGYVPVLADPQLVFDNTSNLINQTPDFFSSREYGDELALAGIARYVTEFKFSYFGNFTNTVGRSYHVRFYANDGTDAFPGPATALRPNTVLWDSGAQALVNGISRVTLGVPSVVVPDSFTWSVTFNGVDGSAGNQAALMLANPATVGALLPGTSTLPPVIGSYDDFWKNDQPDPINDNRGWTLYTFGSGTNDLKGNFYASVRANLSAEPGLELLTDKATFTATANDLIQWNQFTNGLVLKNPETALSTGGIHAQTRLATKTAAVVVSDTSFAYAVGESLVNTRAGGALTLDFDQRIFGFGVELQDAFKSAGTYTLTAFKVTATSTNTLGTFTVNRNAGNALTFVGVEDPRPEINRIKISDDSGHFFLGRIYLKALKSPVAKLVQLSSFQAVRWPVASPGFQVQYTTNLVSPISWKPTTNSIFSLNGFYHQYVTNLIGRGIFFRLAATEP